LKTDAAHSNLSASMSASSPRPGRLGLVTVTFRQLTPEEIVAAAAAAGLSVLEWGGDVHVPPGDNRRAREIGRMTTDAGLETACYGSYYRVGHEGEGGKPPFEEVLSTASALGAPSIRVWAGTRGSDQADDEYFQHVVDDATRIAALAAARGVCVAFEFHGGTVNDTPAAAERLLAALPQENIRSLWQPLPSLDDAARDASLRIVLPRLAHVHVFHWLPGDPIDRRPLAEGADSWARWLAAASREGRFPDALLEFVQGDDPERLAAEAAALGAIMRSVAPG
jgi:3-dehydroshikimate dehydratase